MARLTYNQQQELLVKMAKALEETVDLLRSHDDEEHYERVRDLAMRAKAVREDLEEGFEW